MGRCLEMAGTEVQGLALEGWFCPLFPSFGKWARTDHVCSVDGKLEVLQVGSRWSAPIVAALCCVLPGVFEVKRAADAADKVVSVFSPWQPWVTASPTQHLHPARKRETKSFQYKLIVLSNPKRKGFSVLFPHVEAPSIILPVWIPGQAVHVQNKSSQTPQRCQGCLVHGEGLHVPDMLCPFVFTPTHVLPLVFASPSFRCWGDQRQSLPMFVFSSLENSFCFLIIFTSNSTPVQTHVPSEQQDRLTNNISFSCLLAVWLKVRIFLQKFLWKFLAIPMATCLGTVYLLTLCLMKGHSRYKPHSSQGCRMKCTKCTQALLNRWSWLSHHKSPGKVAVLLMEQFQTFLCPLYSVIWNFYCGFLIPGIAI